MPDDIYLTDAAKEAAKRVARTWNLCDPPSNITAEAAVQIAQAVVNAEQGWHDAAREVIWDTQGLMSAKTLGDQARDLISLSNDVFDLSTWLPGFDSESGEIPHE